MPCCPPRRSAIPRRGWATSRRWASTPAGCSWSRAWTPPPPTTPSAGASLGKWLGDHRRAGGPTGATRDPHQGPGQGLTLACRRACERDHGGQATPRREQDHDQHPYLPADGYDGPRADARPVRTDDGLRRRHRRVVRARRLAGPQPDRRRGHRGVHRRLRLPDRHAVRRPPVAAADGRAAGRLGLLIGLAVAPVIAYYGSMDPRALWEAGGATALFIAGFGAAGYATRRDLTAIARVSFWALLVLIVAGIVLVFVHIPGGDLAYSVLGLVIFAGFTMFDFQRLRTNADITTAPLIAASIFLDVLNVFLFFLEIFSGGERA